MITNGRKRPRSSVFASNDSREVVEPKTWSANVANDSSVGAGNREIFSRAAISRQFPPIDRTSSEKRDCRGRHFPANPANCSDRSRHFPPNSAKVVPRQGGPSLREGFFDWRISRGQLFA